MGILFLVNYINYVITTSAAVTNIFNNDQYANCNLYFFVYNKK